MENALIEQLGINWKLFVSQMVNFFILLGVLTFFVYKPLIKVIKNRNEKIKEGLEKAKEAEIRLSEVDNISKEKIKKAEQESIQIIKATETKAKELEAVLQKKAEDRQKDLMAQVEQNYKKQQEEAKQMVLKDAGELVKKAIIKTVELNPDQIDEALVKKAISELKNS